VVNSPLPSIADSSSPPYHHAHDTNGVFTLAAIHDHPGKTEYRAASFALVIGIALLAIKFTAYFLTGSAAIFSDAMESIVNVAAGGFALYSVYLAHRPADADHPYGHGKIEFLSAGFEGGMIFAAAIVMAVKAVDTLRFHQQVRMERLGTGALLMAVAMLVNGALGYALVASGRRTKSLTLEADGKHLLTDAITSAAALVALGLVRAFDFPAADPLVALLMALLIGRTGFHLIRHSAHGLMDKQDHQDEVLLKQILDAHLAPAGTPPHICSYHKLRHRHSGRYHWVDFHLVLPAHLDIRHGHDIASAIEYEIEQALGEGNATAHIEPCTDKDCAGCRAPAPAVSQH
jgi:cation diffusion facilitator family transporter